MVNSPSPSFWSGLALATGTAWAGLCLIHHHQQISLLSTRHYTGKGTSRWSLDVARRFTGRFALEIFMRASDAAGDSEQILPRHAHAFAAIRRCSAFLDRYGAERARHATVELTQMARVPQRMHTCVYREGADAHRTNAAYTCRSRPSQSQRSHRHELHESSSSVKTSVCEYGSRVSRSSVALQCSCSVELNRECESELGIHRVPDATGLRAHSRASVHPSDAVINALQREHEP